MYVKLAKLLAWFRERCYNRCLKCIVIFSWYMLL